MATGLVPPLVSSNTDTPLLSIGRAAGFGFIVASSLTSTNSGFGAEYQHGTHAQAIYNSQFKGAIFPSQKGNPLSVAVNRFFTASPQTYDFTSQGWFVQPNDAESISGSAEYTFGLHQTQIANSQHQPQIWKSVSLTAVASPVTSFPRLFAQPQELNRDLTLQGSFSSPLVTNGWLLTMVTAGPQLADFTLQASFKGSAVVNILAQWNPTTIFYASQENPYQVPARVIKPQNVPSPIPVVQTLVAQSPDPTQIQPQIFPALVVRVVTYNLPPQFITPPQEYYDVPQGQIAEPVVGQLPINTALNGAAFNFNAGTVSPAAQTLIGIYDYFSLTQAILDFSHRTDIANYIDYYISNGETRIYRDIFAQNIGNGVKWIEQPLTGTLSNGVIAVPANYFVLKAMQLVVGSNNTVQTLIYKDPQWIYANYAARQPQGPPQYVARDGTNFVFGPSPDSAFVVQGTYYGQSTALSATNPLTWMTTTCPDLLLASCMLELQPFLKDTSAMKSWTDIYQSKLRALLDLDQAERMSPGTLTIGNA